MGTAARLPRRASAPLPVRTHRQRPGPRIPAASRLLESDDTASGRARAIIRDALAQWGQARLSDDAEQIISEIISNAVAASSDATPEGDMPGPIVLHVTADNGVLTMCESDPDPTPPPCDQELPDAYDEHGRGLDHRQRHQLPVGMDPAPSGGKYVFATLRTEAQPGGDRKNSAVQDRPADDGRTHAAGQRSAPCSWPRDGQLAWEPQFRRRPPDPPSVARAIAGTLARAQ